MDPLSAFSLAAGVLQLIDFTTKLASKGYEIHKSATGVLAEHVSIESATLRLTSLSEAIQSSSQSSTDGSEAASSAQSALSNVVIESLAIAKDINDALQKLKTKNDSKHESARVALRAVFKQKKLSELETKLTRCRQEMLVNFVVIIQSDIGSVGERLESFRKDNDAAHKATQRELNTAVDKIIAAIEASRFSSSNDVDLEEITRRLNQINIGSKAEQAFLDDLYIPILDSRERQIVNAADNTFEWLFRSVRENSPSIYGSEFSMEDESMVEDESNIDDGSDIEDGRSSANASSAHEDSPSIQENDDNLAEVVVDEVDIGDVAEDTGKTGFTEWLRTGDSIFWITGKPGSGKSTLMKFITKDRRTHAALQQWAGESQLVTATSYFWISGDPRQRSLTGLWRSLFYHILSKHQCLIRSLFPWRWRRYENSTRCTEEWTDDEFLEAMKKLPSITDESYKFCFFIDGLDEYDGNHSKLTALLHELANNRNLKLCVSSRPWTVFQSSFSNQRRIQVHQWTMNDIRNFIQEQFQKEPIWISLRSDEPEEARNLCDQISNSAEGVFLWVYLVVQEFKTALDAGDTFKELTNRLRGMPLDLDAFFKRMLDKIPRLYKSQAVAYLKLALAIHKQHRIIAPLWMFSFAEMRSPDFGESAVVQPAKISQVLRKYETFARKIQSHCEDLLVVKYFDDKTPTTFRKCMHAEVLFTHRSVSDYLASTWPDALDFNIEEWAWQAILAEAKSLPLGELRTHLAPGILNSMMYHGDMEPSIKWLEELRTSLGSNFLEGEQNPQWPCKMNPSNIGYGSFSQMCLTYKFWSYLQYTFDQADCKFNQKTFLDLFEAAGRRHYDIVSPFPHGEYEWGYEKYVRLVSSPDATIISFLERSSKRLYDTHKDEFYWQATWEQLNIPAIESHKYDIYWNSWEDTRLGGVRQADGHMGLLKYMRTGRIVRHTLYWW